MQLSRDVFYSPVNDVLIPPNYFFSKSAPPHENGRDCSESQPAANIDKLRYGPEIP